MAEGPKRRRRPVRPGWFARHRKGQPASESELRRLFRDRQILERAARGELKVKVVKDAHPSPPLADEPECTRSQLLAYYDSEGNKIAEAHRYLRADGTLGASGKPDPKEMLDAGTLYYLDLR